MELSALQKNRLLYNPPLPDLLREVDRVRLVQKTGGKIPPEPLRKLFPKTFDAHPHALERGAGEKRPLRIGAVFSGGQASGGHNVLGGILHAILAIHPGSKLIGFLGGPEGIVKNEKKELTKDLIAAYMNQGGFDLIGTGRTKIETGEQLAAAFAACKENSLDALIVIGGDDSNTNAALLAEYFIENGCPTRVIGVPKTIDGDLRSPDIEVSFGFDSACKTYADIIGNIARDALSAKKYYHFIKLMGRSASHIALECALATHPNLALIGEERQTLSAIVGQIADLICRRSRAGKDYGVILVPEGLIEFIPEIRTLIASLNRHLADDPASAVEKLTQEEKTVFSRLGEKIQKQLLLDRDPHGNVTVSQIDTQVLLMDLVNKELKGRSDYKGKFSAQDHFLGYEGRSCFPTNFDASYGYALGHLAAIAARDHLTGVICAIQHLNEPPARWTLKAVPIVQLMRFETRKGKEKPVIQKALVDLQSKPYLEFAAMRKAWEMDDCYRYPGPIQFFGAPELTDAPPLTL